MAFEEEWRDGAGGSGDAKPVLGRRTRGYLTELLSRYLKLPPAEIRSDVPFGRYGIDSVVTIAMTEELESALGTLSKTLFFEYDSIDELAKHLLSLKFRELYAHFGLAEPRLRRSASEAAPEPGPLESVAQAPMPGTLSGKWALLSSRGRGASLPEYPDPAPATAASEPSRSATSDGAHDGDDDIAVIGLAGRYPQSPDLDTFWENLSAGKDCVTEIPARRWDHSRYFDEERGKPGKTYARWGGFLDDVEFFDPLFFNISPAEAEFLDPQERLFLETTWQAIEDACYPRHSLAGRKVGVFAGVMFGLYQLLGTDRDGGWVNGTSSYASVANRVSYFFDLRGPSMTLDSMCSSSLVAVHQACASIRNGESELAIAGGVNVMSHPAKYVQLSQDGFLSSDGRCRSFGAGGDGYVPGEGAGAVLLKPLRAARADGDRVHAVIRGSAVNAGGHTGGYTVPSPQAQSALIQDALETAGVGPREISYVEAHGTGTALGDPIEVTGLTKAYREYTADTQFCAIGSVKSNVGHLESAAGIAALTKVILQFRNRMLAPSLHASTPNPLIDFANSPFYLQRELGSWERPDVPGVGGSAPRMAAISAFGAGGTNAHLIVEEPPTEPEERVEAHDEPREQLIVLSARTESALAARSRQLLDAIDKNNGVTTTSPPGAASTTGALRTAVLDVVGIVAGIPSADLDEDEPYVNLGLDTYGIADLHERLREWLIPETDRESLRQQPTVSRTVNHLAEILGAEEKPRAVPEPEAGRAPLRLADLAFTLQAGRDPMRERLAVTVGDMAQLRQGLQAYLDGRTDVSGVRWASTEDHQHKLHPLLTHEVTTNYLRRMLADERLDEVAELWVMGADVDWSALWQRRRARKLPLPTYPFDREAHWIIAAGPDDPLVPATASGSGQPSPVRADPPTRREHEKLDESATYDAVLTDLKHCFSDILRIPEERLRPHTAFEEYGLDSVRITRISQLLEQTYGALPKSLLFNYRDLNSLTHYLCANHGGLTQGSVTEATTQRPVLADARPGRDDELTDTADIAIIGLSGRYPQAATLAEFEANLAGGKDCVTEIPSERWDHNDYPDVECKWGGFLDDALTFDPLLFNLSPNAAAYMDPQERIFLQSVWHCIEDAGYRPQALADRDVPERGGNVAVYAGVSFNEYGLYGAADLATGKDVPVDTQLYSVANRVSYLLNLRGPSLVVDTACSSSLYAIHLACEALRHGDCELAIAGGVNLSLHPNKYQTLNRFGFLAPDGHCKSFGEGGDGYVPGEGVGAVLLKPLARAEADGDHIYGVIKGTAVNHGGRTNGYSVPNPAAQREVVRSALDRSDVPAASISYLEAHGTGTSLGDAIELESLSEVFAEVSPEGARCPIGSVKSNIGHLEAAAGISQVTKVLLQLRSGQLFPSRLNADRINPDLDFSGVPFRVQLDNEPWRPAYRPDDGTPYPRRAGISSFGVGGVNVHIVLEQYTTPSRNEAHATGPELIPLSARTPDSLVRYAEDLRDFVEAGTPPDLADMAFTLQTGREAQRYRVAFVAEDHAQLAEQLRTYVAACGADGAGSDIFTGDARSASVPEVDGDEASMSTLPRDRARLGMAGGLWVRGADVPFEAWHKEATRRRVSLPGYPFERQTYWMYEAPVRGASAPGARAEILETPDVREPQHTEDANRSMEDQDVECDPAPADPARSSIGDGADREFIGELADAFDDERLDLMTEYLQVQVSQFLGFTEDRPPETDQGFFDLGMDSITATQTYNRLTQCFGLELDLQLFFNYPTIRDVAAYLLDLLDVDSYEPRPAASETALEQSERAAETWLFVRDWVDSEVVGSEVSGHSAGSGGTILLFDTNETLLSALTALPDGLRPDRVVMVRPGTGFRDAGCDQYEVDPSSRADYEALFKTLAAASIDIDRIIHFWSMPEYPLDRVVDGLDRGVYALAALSQGLLAYSPNRRVALLYAFANQAGTAAPENRGIGGFARAVRMDNPVLSYKTVEFTRANLSRARMARVLMTEFDQPDDAIEVRHDGKQRRQRCLRLAENARGEQQAFTTGGVYLVTGGLGGLAGIVAAYLCREYQAKVVLVGRSDPDDDALGELRSWCSDGAEVAYLAADVGDRDAVADLVHEVKSRYGRITGVLHAAGVLRDGSIKDKQPQDMDDVFRAKIFGTRYLDEVLRDEPLDCFVLFSSLASVLGNFGQSDTCFAGGYLDSFADYRERQRERGERSGHTLSVNWSFWRDGKLKPDESVLTLMRGRFGIEMLEMRDGWEALKASLGVAAPQVVVIKGDLAKITRVLEVPEPDVGDVQDSSTEDTELLWPYDESRGGRADIEEMSEQELVALLEEEIELSMTAGGDVA